MRKLREILNDLWKYIDDAKAGLPEEVFEFASSITPMVNVDLLVRGCNGRILLSWRDDEYCGKGWHVPGGIVRFKETREKRIQEVAKKELGTTVTFGKEPLAIKDIIMNQEIRGHFISFIYDVQVPESYVIDNKGKTVSTPGYLQWHDKLPKDMVKGQENVYNELVNENIITSCETNINK